jgi:hypothetical protein
MRTLSPNIARIISENNATSFLLIDIGPFEVYNENNIKVTMSKHYVTLSHNISTEVVTEESKRFTAIPVGQPLAYDCNHTLVSVDPPRMSKSLDREAFKLTFADPKFAIRTYIGSGIPGSNLRVRAGFIENNIELTEYVTIYTGTIDTQAYSIDPNGDTLMAIEGSSPMGPLGLTRTILTSREWFSSKYPGDTCCDQSFIGSRNSTIDWGRNRD